MYLDTLPCNIGFAISFGLFAGLIWGAVTFATIGTLVGFIVYEYFKSNEYYFYYNYGYSKNMLMFKVWIFNVISMLILIGLFILCSNFI